MCEPAATVYIVVCVGSWIIRARPNGFRNNAVGLAGSCGLYKISQWQPGDGSSAADPLFTALRNTTVLPTDRYTHVHLPGIYICAIFFFIFSSFYFFTLLLLLLFDVVSVSVVRFTRSTVIFRRAFPSKRRHGGCKVYTHGYVHGAAEEKRPMAAAARVLRQCDRPNAAFFFFRCIDARPCF